MENCHLLITSPLNEGGRDKKAKIIPAKGWKGDLASLGQGRT